MIKEKLWKGLKECSAIEVLRCRDSLSHDWQLTRWMQEELLLILLGCLVHSFRLCLLISSMVGYWKETKGAEAFKVKEWYSSPGMKLTKDAG